jgi:glutaminyl-tRNA synthetase
MIGVTKSDSWIDMGVLEECQRDHLNETAPRRIAVLDPVKLVIDNYPEGQEEECLAPNHPQKPEWGKRPVPFSKELWIEREDFMEVPSKGYFRLFPGNTVRLRYGFVVKCTGFDQDAAGGSPPCIASTFPDSKSGTPGSDSYKVKGNIHWVSAQAAYAAEVRLYDRLFAVEAPGEGDRDFIADLNPDRSCVIHRATRGGAEGCRAAEVRFQFERHGYFVADRIDSKTRRAGVQSHGDAAGFVGEGKIRERRTRSGFDSSSHQEASKCANLPVLSLPPAQASRPTPTP